jgi:hypothetical protein
MPYIDEQRRVELGRDIGRLDDQLARMGDVAGDLNYVIFILMYRQFKRKRRYTTLNRVVGAVLSSVAEFQRRVVGPYEDEAIKRNGDILR